MTKLNKDIENFLETLDKEYKEHIKKYGHKSMSEKELSRLLGLC